MLAQGSHGGRERSAHDRRLLHWCEVRAEEERGKPRLGGDTGSRGKWWTPGRVLALEMGPLDIEFPMKRV